MDTRNVPHQHEIDAAAAAILRMTPAEAKLIEAIAWQLAKDNGYDDWREALQEARKVCAGWKQTRRPE